MTPKQTERIRNKIKKIKHALAADKKHWGGYYHDGGGLRYLPPELYLKLKDYSGALRYFNWFDKNFPEDSGHPIFLFEWTITLFKKKKLKQAEHKALKTFYANTYIIDTFLGNELLHFDKSEHSNWEYSSMVEHLKYSKTQEELYDFTEWLTKFSTSETFYDFANTLISINTELNHESDRTKRSLLINKKYQLLERLNQI